MATVESVTPRKGKVGNTAVLHGDGLAGTTFIVRFGRATAADAANPGNSPENIKCTIPSRNALDPLTVPITVTIDGVPATIAADVSFEYNVPQPEPTIDPVTTFAYDPSTKVLTVTVTGSGFVTPTRSPDLHNVFVVDAATGDGATVRTTPGNVLAGFTATMLSLEFAAVSWREQNTVANATIAVVVGFNDGSSATSPEFTI